MRLDSQGDGDWVGFIFPELLTSREMVNFRNRIDLQYAQFGTVSLRAGFAKSLVADHSIARGDFILGGAAASSVSFCNAEADSAYKRPVCQERAETG